MKAYLQLSGIRGMAIVMLMLLIAGCGGGSDNSAKSGTVVDPAPAFKGVTSQASVTETNAEELAMGAYGGGSIAAAIGSVSKTADEEPVGAHNKRPVLLLAQALKQTVRRMDFPQKAVLQRKSVKTAGNQKTAGRANNYVINGDNGGTASYVLDINDTNGSFFGTITYQGFTSNGLIVDGVTDVLGTFDVNRQQLSRLTLSFKTLSLKLGSSAFSLTGSLSWGFNLTTSIETLSMNMVLMDVATSKTYWFNNYEIATEYNVSTQTQTQTMTGRYYDHENGYVVFSTLTPLVTSYGYHWPTQGLLNFSAKQNTWLKMNFQPQSVAIEADCNGDGVSDWQVELTTDDTPSVNLPPVANAGTDQNVKQWSIVQLDGSASSDPNGDHLSYYWSLNSWPANGYVSLSMSNSATPTFVASQPGTYIFSLSVYDGYNVSQQDAVTVVVEPVAPRDPSFVAKKWQYGEFGDYIGLAGLFVTDLDNDGAPEIVATARFAGYGPNDVWYVVRQNALGTYEQVGRSPIYGTSITRLLLEDMNGDGKKEIVVALSDGTIHVYDGSTLSEIRSLSVTAPLSDIAIADLDHDGLKEIITSNGIGVSVYGYDSGELKWSVTTGGGSSLAVGNVDDDDALEIVTTTYGGKGYVLNGLSGAIKWEYINSFGAKVLLEDLDGDGKKELIGAYSWYKITIFDADIKSPSWEIATSQDISSLTVTDVDGDGIPEIIYGDGQWGKVHTVDVNTHKEKWSVTNPEHGISGIAIGDVDRNGKNEVIWGAGGTSSGPDFLYIADPESNTIKWQNIDFSGLSALSLGDVDNDGEDDLVMVSASSNSGYAGGIISIFGARSHILKFQSTLEQTDWMGYNRVVGIADVNGDGQTDIVINSSYCYDGFIRVYDGVTRSLTRQSSSYYGNFFASLAIGDVDNDGKTEIVAGQGRAHSGAAGAYLIVFDGDSLQEKWRSIDLGAAGGALNNIRLADLDDDGHKDIIATVSDSRLIVFDGVTHALKLMIESPARSLEVADLDGDGALEILVGRSDGRIDVYDGVTFTIKKTISSFSTTPVDALRIADLDGNGTKEIITASNGIMSIQDDQGLVWRSRNLGFNLGRNNSIAIKDVNGNGRQDIFIGSDTDVYQYE